MGALAADAIAAVEGYIGEGGYSGEAPAEEGYIEEEEEAGYSAAPCAGYVAGRLATCGLASFGGWYTGLDDGNPAGALWAPIPFTAA